jgi:hypothetical protein
MAGQQDEALSRLSEAGRLARLPEMAQSGRNRVVNQTTCVKYPKGLIGFYPKLEYGDMRKANAQKGECKASLGE